MRGPARRRQPRAIRAARAARQPVVRRLAVDQKPRSGRNRVRRLRTFAAALFADDEQQPDTRLAVFAQPLCGRNLRDDRALGVARAAPVESSRALHGSE
jgi:hypothetical protein